jgi:hypothetical protein
MKLNALPRRPGRHQIDWSAIIPTYQPGQSLVIECKSQSQAYAVRTTASKRARELGIHHHTSVRKGIVTITILDPIHPEKTISGSLKRLLASAQAAKNLPMRIMEAKRKAAEWKARTYTAELPADYQAALANHAAWKMTARRLQTQLQDRTSNS